MMEDWEFVEGSCKYCRHPELRGQRCPEFTCEDGAIDLYEEDPINYAPGAWQLCTECRGSGYVVWCPHCGKDQ